jgi:hypothetical protein
MLWLFDYIVRRIIDEIRRIIRDRSPNQSNKKRSWAEAVKSNWMECTPRSYTKSIHSTIESRTNKDYYLSKKYAQSHLNFYINE